MRQPIWVLCEGSGCPPAGGSTLCSMCGESWAKGRDGNVLEHHRKDILTMLDRGDFDAHNDGGDHAGS